MYMSFSIKVHVHVNSMYIKFKVTVNDLILRTLNKKGNPFIKPKGNNNVCKGKHSIQNWEFASSELGIHLF